MSAVKFLDAHTRAVLESAEVDGQLVRLTCGQLTPEEYAPVKQVLETLGGQWSRSAKALVFPDWAGDPAVLIRDTLTVGIMPLHPRTRDGFVATPADLATEIVKEYGEIEPARGRVLRVLEPSAGTGNLVRAITGGLQPDWLHVTAVEPDNYRASMIPRGDHVMVVVEPFEQFTQIHTRRLCGGFDVIVMNPPFAKPGKAALWAEHVLLAWDLLAPGGRLVAITPRQALQGGGKPGRAVAALVREHGGGHELGPDAFAEAGTQVQTAVIWLDRPLRDTPADVPASPPQPWMLRAYTGGEVPVQVPRPYLTPAAARFSPVQVWHSPWHGRDRVLRYWASCATCARPIWGFDDGQNDPRGVLGDAGGEVLTPEEGGAASGPPLVACFLCVNDHRRYERALSIARPHWAQVATVATSPRGQQAAATTRQAAALGAGWAALRQRAGLAPAV